MNSEIQIEDLKVKVEQLEDMLYNLVDDYIDLLERVRRLEDIEEIDYKCKGNNDY